MAGILWTGATRLDIIICAIALFLLLILTAFVKPTPKGLRLPPGPRGKLIVGNVTDMPERHEWETYTRWAKEYGDLVYVKILRQPMIFVNSVDVAQELFEKKSSNTNDRFDFPMLSDLMGFEWNWVLNRYGERWRRHRKLFQQSFRPAAVTAYHGTQTKQAQELLRRLHDSPDDFIRHIRHLSGSIIMEIIYGIETLPKGDPYIQIAEDAFAAASIAANPGSFLVDTFPILKYVPEWMPGAGFRKQARIWRQIITQMPFVPFMAVKEALRAGTARPSFTASLLEQLSQRGDAPADEEGVIRNTAATAYGAGADTTTTALSWFMLAMVLYPKTKKKAQAELDSVVGTDRLPTFEDRENLPYVNALCKEVHRWHPVFPLGVAHGVIQDDVYEDQFIPGGSILVGNAWAMLHDEKMYGPNTQEFDPDRFLRDGVRDPTVAFGFGRRICPGRYMADNTIWIAIVSMLHVFDISAEKDNQGNEIPVNVSFTSGAISRPDPFRCAITPRSASAESMLLEKND